MNITFDDVSFKYIERKILDHASFSITDLDKVGIVGVNGTGKTTMLKLIMKQINISILYMNLKILLLEYYWEQEKKIIS